MKLIKTILPNIWCTRNEYPFGGTTIKTRAFLIERPKNNNVWIYGSSHTKDYLHHIKELSGVKLQLINHRDEASKFCNVLRSDDAPIFCHAKEQAAIEAKGVNMKDAVTFDGRKQQVLDDDLIAYHTPGHTQGVTSYYYKPQGEDFTVLFTGDSLYYSNPQGRYNIGPMTFHAYNGNVQDMINTLTFIKDESQPTYIASGLIEGNGNESDEEDMNTFITKFQPEHVKYHIDQLQLQKKTQKERV